MVVVKLKTLKFKLKGWNKEVFGRGEVRKYKALQNLAKRDSIATERPLVHSELERKT